MVRIQIALFVTNVRRRCHNPGGVDLTLTRHGQQDALALMYVRTHLDNVDAVPFALVEQNIARGAKIFETKVQCGNIVYLFIHKFLHKDKWLSMIGWPCFMVHPK